MVTDSPAVAPVETGGTTGFSAVTPEEAVGTVSGMIGLVAGDHAVAPGVVRPAEAEVMAEVVLLTDHGALPEPAVPGRGAAL